MPGFIVTSPCLLCIVVHVCIPGVQLNCSTTYTAGYHPTDKERFVSRQITNEDQFDSIARYEWPIVACNNHLVILRLYTDNNSPGGGRLVPRYVSKWGASK